MEKFDLGDTALVVVEGELTDAYCVPQFDDSVCT